jgi:hypothetical protein
MQHKRTAITDSHPIDNILSSLENVIETQKYQYRAKCPVHQKSNSQSRTLSIKEATDGNVLLHCFGGCDYEEVLSAIGLEKKHLFPPETYIANWAYDRDPLKKSPKQLIAELKPSMTYLQILISDIEKNWDQLATVMGLDRRDLHVFEGVAFTVREALDDY